MVPLTNTCSTYHPSLIFSTNPAPNLLSKMSFFCDDEKPPNSANRRRFFTSSLKDAFCTRHGLRGRHSCLSLEDDEYLVPDMDDDEQEVMVSTIITRATEAKLRRKSSLYWFFSPSTGDLLVTPKAVQQIDDSANEDYKERDEFHSVKCCFSRCSSVGSREGFLSARTNFSRCSSLSALDFQELRRRSIIQEFCHCEGWPFGLCRRAVLLPPLPKSPVDSWSWHKRARRVNLYQC
ncbi:hypothetical protein RJ641_032215 [Dillenia turbinata]|uniref:Uncharacterized protein n=1 Tax=Dillenia turbinata TaxID=194707 RepID=A0AAN8VZM8_9MAGN